MATQHTFRDQILLPAIASVLPWPLAFALFKRLVRHPLYAAQTAAALHGAQRLQTIVEPAPWCERHRLTRLCDHADLYLSLTRSNAWMRRHLRVRGSWPAEHTPFLALTFHWGAGMWSLRHMRAQGIRSAFLSARFDRSSFAGNHVAYRYALLRSREVERASGAKVIFTGGAAEGIRAAWQEGLSVVALYDVPPQQTKGSLPGRVLDRTALLPGGLVRLACAERVPVAPFCMSIDHETGMRTLDILPMWTGTDEGDLAAYIAAYFDRMLRSDLSAWHRCADAESFFPELAENARQREVKPGGVSMNQSAPSSELPFIGKRSSQ